MHQIILDRHRMFEHACASDVSGLRHWRISLKMAAPWNPTWSVSDIINCFLTIFVHNYYVQPICYIDVRKLCESLTDWSIPLRRNIVVYRVLFARLARREWSYPTCADVNGPANGHFLQGNGQTSGGSLLQRTWSPPTDRCLWGMNLPLKHCFTHTNDRSFILA